jgi:hypothetical protein
MGKKVSIPKKSSKTKVVPPKTVKISQAVDSDVPPVSIPKGLVTLPKAVEVCQVLGLGVTYRILRKLVLTGRVKVYKQGTWSYVCIEALIEALKDPNSAIYQ